ncbi:MAG: UDP-N-acetylmuramate dehydrogenase [Patescibacteria group bacterium]
MKLEEHVPLAPLTTLGVGGTARFFVEAHTEADIEDAIALARTQNLPLFALGKGSNVLVPDTGIEGVVLKIAMRDSVYHNADGSIVLIAGAGALWDDVVDEVGRRGIFGIENLAGIPGTIGGAAVQNIGAYGAEFSTVFEYADSIDSTLGVRRRITRAEAAFAYRTSFFKKHRELIITKVALRFAKNAIPNIAYADVARMHAAGEPLSTPADIARAIRAIRAKKFPHAPEEGTAGSFFKNSIISRELADSLERRFPGLPTFSQEDGSVKIPLAWLFDHVLSLKGFTKGRVRLYEEQPLIIVTRAGARAAEVDALAREVTERVRRATGITIEREVETFGEIFFS